MRSSSVRYIISHLVAFSFAALVTVSFAVADGDKVAKKSQYASAITRKRQAVGRLCAVKLEAAQEAIAAQQWSRAERVLNAAAGKHCATSFEKSQVWNYLGYVYFSRQNYPQSLVIYLKLIDEPEVERKMKVSTFNTVAQLYFQLEDYTNAAEFLERWIEALTADGQAGDPQTKALLAQAYYQLDRKQASLRYVGEAIGDYRAKGKLPPESWWSLQSLLYFEQQQYRLALPVLKQLITHYPRYRYWHQLGGLYGELDEDMERLVATEIVYLAGALNKERELISLAYLYLGANTPYQAAKILDTAINNGSVGSTGGHLELLGLAWQQAGEGKRARPVLEKAATLSGQGNIYAQLASVYLDIGDSASAVAAARNAIDKGELKKPGFLQLVLGNAQLNLHCYDHAAKAFEQAGKYRAVATKAGQWLDYAQAEGERVKELQAAGADLPACDA